MLSALLLWTSLSPTSATPPATQSPLCITFDRAADKLSPGEQETALALLEQAVAATGGRMAKDGCADPLAISHVKVGPAVSVALRSPGGARFAQAASLEALPEAYVQLLASADRAPAPSEAPPSVATRTAEPPPERPSAFGFGDGHGQFYARLGYSGTVRDGLNTGPSLGLGYRREIGNVVFDISSVNMNFWRHRQYDGYEGTWNAFLRLMAFRYLGDLLGGHNFYAGAGLSYGETKTPDGLHGEGMQGDAGVGYELLRHTVMRTFIQVVATVPFYTAFKDDFAPYNGSSAPSGPLRTTGYAFSVATSIGVGF